MPVDHEQLVGAVRQFATHPQVAHHQVCTIGVTPVIVERDDVGMFQPGDDLCFDLETADKIGMIGILG